MGEPSLYRGFAALDKRGHLLWRTIKRSEIEAQDAHDRYNSDPTSERMGQSGLGLEAQRAAVSAHVLGRGEVASGFVEVESGKRADRPELAREMAEAKLAGAVFLIAKLDRLARNVAFIANLLESGVEVTAAYRCRTGSLGRQHVSHLVLEFPIIPPSELLSK